MTEQGQERQRVYAAIDLKSFYASVECNARGLDPLTTNLVVADQSRTEKTICLAVSPSLKSHGIPGRPRLFEVVERVREVNAERKAANGGRPLGEAVYDDQVLRADPSVALGYITATPRMALYIEVSTKIYEVYLGFVSAEDVHVYSIDEVFIDLTPYLTLYGMSPHDLVRTIVSTVLEKTGITATAGIGTNMYLAKVAMDIVAKHLPADADGVRIAELDEASYRRKLWCHRPLTDFWRVGPGYARKLEVNGMHTMGDVARQSVRDEELLYRLFGVNAEYLIDHAWGVEPTTIADVHAYKPKTSSLGSGQVLPEPYTAQKCRVIVREMAEEVALSLVAKHLVADQLTLTVGYDRANIDEGRGVGRVAVDYYGRVVPWHAHGTANLGMPTSSTRIICEAAVELFDRIVDGALLMRRVNVTATRVLDEEEVSTQPVHEQLNLFVDYDELDENRELVQAELDRERREQEQILAIKRKFGKNAILKGTNFKEGARGAERNAQIGGHKA